MFIFIQFPCVMTKSFKIFGNSCKQTTEVTFLKKENFVCVFLLIFSAGYSIRGRWIEFISLR